jgi:hypothetical protein
MGVVSVTHLSQLERAERTLQGIRNTRVYQVTLDDLADGPCVARDAADVPRPGDPHPFDASARVVRIVPQPTQPQNRLVWNVNVEYETPNYQAGHDKEEENPLDDRVQISWGTRDYERALERDRNGVAVLNSAHDPFDPCRLKTVHVMTLRVVRNEAFYSPALAFTYLGGENGSAVNSDTCTICGLTVSPRQAHIILWSGDSAERNGIPFWTVTYEFEFNPETWDETALDLGLYQLTGLAFPNDKKKCIRNGESAVEPQLLDGTGYQLPVGGTPVFLSWRCADELPFSVLNLNIVV